MKRFKFPLSVGKLTAKQRPAVPGAEHERHEAVQGDLQMQQKKPQRRRWHYMLLAAAGLTLLTGILVGAERRYVEANTVTYYNVLLHGEVIGTVEDKQLLDDLFERKLKEYQEKYPDKAMALQTKGYDTELVEAFKPVVDTEATLAKINGMLKAYALGVELVVDGKTVGIVSDQETAAAVLEGVKAHYLPGTEEGADTQPAVMSMKRMSADGSAADQAPADGVESVAIREEVGIVPVHTDPNKVLSAEDAIRALTEGKEAPLMYTVREGDTISSIAKLYNIPQQDIYANNPEVKELTLQIGDELQLTVPQAELTVVTVEQITEQIETEPQVIVEKRDDLPAGQTKVVRAGQAGLKEMQYRITKENGYVIREEWLGQTVIRESLPEVVYTGTKVVGKGSGSFAWPVKSATITSSFGQRWGRAHQGTDFVSGNRNIYASDGGVVTFAGTKSGYGNVVIIDHRNGYETVYGHLSRYSVSVGQKLEKGATIGIMGNTGRSTGTHLHFEIRKNGTPVNPMRYL